MWPGRLSNVQRTEEELHSEQVMMKRRGRHVQRTEEELHSEQVLVKRKGSQEDACVAVTSVGCPVNRGGTAKQISDDETKRKTRRRLRGLVVCRMSSEQFKGELRSKYAMMKRRRQEDGCDRVVYPTSVEQRRNCRANK